MIIAFIAVLLKEEPGSSDISIKAVNISSGLDYILYILKSKVLLIIIHNSQYQSFISSEDA